MTHYRQILNELFESRLLPGKRFIAAERYFKPYENENSFYTGILLIPYFSIMVGISFMNYALHAVWATLRAVGNLLILKPDHATAAMVDVGFYSLLTIALAVMAPIHALAHAFKALTRTISSWFMEQEPTNGLTELSFVETAAIKIKHVDDLLPSSTYFKSSRFFSPYGDAFDCIQQFARPIGTTARSIFHILNNALAAIYSAIKGLTNILICKPKHALENWRDCGVYTSIIFSLALMAPVNALVEALAFVCRLATTWVSACANSAEVDEENHESATPLSAPAM